MRCLLTILALLALALAPAAAAPGKGKGKSKSKHAFKSGEVQIIMEYYGGCCDGGREGLPPGLAKRGGDLPPGLEKQLRRNGRLPPGLEKKVEPFPVELAHRLPPPPYGCRRVVYDRWAMLIQDATNVVLDIIDLRRR